MAGPDYYVLAGAEYKVTGRRPLSELCIAGVDRRPLSELCIAGVSYRALSELCIAGVGYRQQRLKKSSPNDHECHNSLCSGRISLHHGEQVGALRADLFLVFIRIFLNFNLQDPYVQ